MTWSDYTELFEQILKGALKESPYNKEEYINYVRMNRSRMKRWLKKGELTDAAKASISSVRSVQNWILITEPWCGDAAQIAPFIHKMSALNPNIHLTIQLRDTDSEIDRYMTNNAKAIPKLIVRDEAGNDIFTWGPRPQSCTLLVKEMKTNGSTPLEIKEIIQQWYNSNEGREIQKEISVLIADQVGILS